MQYFFNVGPISPSSVGLKSPSGGGEIQPIRGEKMTNEYDADSELPYTREIHGTRNRRAVNTQEGAGRSRWLSFFLLPAIVAVFSAYCTSATDRLSSAYRTEMNWWLWLSVSYGSHAAYQVTRVKPNTQQGEAMISCMINW